MEEISILESKIFRDALTKLDFAEIWVSPSFDPFFNFEKGSGKTLDTILAYVAKISGYEELNFVPYLAIGHSAAASWPYYLAAWNPERTIAALSVSGQWPILEENHLLPIFGKIALLILFPRLKPWANMKLLKHGQMKG
jgi:hypothetical protein